MSVIARFLPDNPVLTKELRVRMRGARAYWILFGYLGFLSVMLCFLYYGWQNQVHSSGSGASEAGRLGTEIFTYLLVAQMFLVLFITPAITSGALTIEKEQRTLDMLTLTRIPRYSIILGKLLAAVSFTALLIISSLPLISICFMLGSIDPKMVLSTYVEMLMGSVLIGSLGLMWSAVLKTTTTAVMATYGCLFLLLVTVLGYGIQTSWSQQGNGGLFGSCLYALYSAWFGNSFLGITIIEGVGFAMFCAMGAWLLCAIAMARLEMFPERKATLLRLLAAAVVGVQVLSLNSWWVHAWYNRGSTATMVAVEPPIGVLLFTGMVLLCLAPIYCTGEVPPYEARHYLSYLAKGWTLKGLRRGKLHSGLPYMLLLTLLLLGLYALPFVFAGKTAGITHSSVGGATPPTATTWNGGPAQTQNGLPPGYVLSPNGQMVPAPAPAPPAKTGPLPKVGDFPQAAIALLATMLGLGLLCQFLSVAFRSRWIAWLIATLLLILSFVVPEIATFSANSRADLSIFNQLFCDMFYLNPLQAILQMLDPANYMDHRYLTFEVPVWQVTTIVWLSIGALSFVAALPFAHREGKRQVPIPYEEQILEA